VSRNWLTSRRRWHCRKEGFSRGGREKRLPLIHLSACRSSLTQPRVVVSRFILSHSFRHDVYAPLASPRSSLMPLKPVQSSLTRSSVRLGLLVPVAFALTLTVTLSHPTSSIITHSSLCTNHRRFYLECYLGSTSCAQPRASSLACHRCEQLALSFRSSPWFILLR
jgi:hypothetical protein